MSTQLLRSGARGKAVSELQGLLNQQLQPSPGLTTDGMFGPKTRRSVLDFQRSRWLVEDACVGPATWAALKETEKYRIHHRVTLVPQKDNSACWLASASMILNRSLSRADAPSELIGEGGGLLNDSALNDAQNTQAFARHFNLRMHYPQSWTVSGLASVLRKGPVATHILWNVSGYVSGAGSSGHFAVIAGLRGDGTAIGTTLRIYDPWPPNTGRIASFGYHRLMHGTPALTYQLFHR